MKSMTCNHVHELLSPYLENELDAVTTLGIAGHLETCAPCRREFERLTEINTFVKRTLSASPKPEFLAERAAVLNNRVREAILAEIGTGTASPSHVEDSSADEFLEAAPSSSATVVAFKRRQPFLLKLRKMAIAASVLLATTAIGLAGFMSYMHRSGPLLAATARNHHVCSRIEKTGFGWAKGNDQIEKLLAASRVACPKLTGLGLQLDGAHFCRITDAAFVHMLYMKDGKPISVYYGGHDALARLRDAEGEISPDKIYQTHNAGVRVCAFVCGSGERMWMIAGDLSDLEAETVADTLKAQSSPNPEGTP